MWTDQVILERRKPAVVHACKLMLSEGRAMNLVVLFPMRRPIEVGSPERMWQKRVMTSFIAMGIVMRQHNPVLSSHPRHVLKHPPGMQKLLDDDEAGGSSLNDIVLKAFSLEPDDNSDLGPPVPEPEEEEPEEEESEEEPQQEVRPVITVGTSAARTAIIEYLEGQNVVATIDIGTEALGYEAPQINTYVMQQIGSVLRDLGWRKGQTKGSYGVKSRRVWIREGHDPDDVPLEDMAADLSPPPEANGASDAVSLLKSMIQAVQYSVEVQNKIAENLVYMRDRGDELLARVEAIESRLGVVGQGPVLDRSAVSSLKEAVTEALDARSSQSNAKANQLQSELKQAMTKDLSDVIVATGKLSAEIRQLCAAAKGIVSGVKDG